MGEELKKAPDMKHAVLVLESGKAEKKHLKTRVHEAKIAKVITCVLFRVLCQHIFVMFMFHFLCLSELSKHTLQYLIKMLKVLSGVSSSHACCSHSLLSKSMQEEHWFKKKLIVVTSYLILPKYLLSAIYTK